MPEQSKFENVDVTASLEAIMKQNTGFYQSDLEIDKEIIAKAAASPRKEDKTLLWFCRPSGTHCFRECFYPLGSYPLLRRKSDFAKLPQKKNAAISKKITTLSKSCSVLSRTFLFALFFDFGNLFCRCGHNPYACIAHTVKERVKLPPLCVLCSGRV